MGVTKQLDACWRPENSATGVYIRCIPSARSQGRMIGGGRYGDRSGIRSENKGGPHARLQKIQAQMIHITDAIKSEEDAGND